MPFKHKKMYIIIFIGIILSTLAVAGLLSSLSGNKTLSNKDPQQQITEAFAADEALIVQTEPEQKTEDEDQKELQESTVQAEKGQDQKQQQTSEPLQQPTTTTLQCGSDCTLAPVDKQKGLASNYVPSVVSTNLPGGGSVAPAIKADLQALFSAAGSNGIHLEIISAYRSYATQQSTFEYWVGQEMAAGLNRAEAEKEANTYSAMPGHSEHQLGTTVDLKCVGCTAFNATDNIDVYDFIEAKAHLHGFVVSYPEGMQAQTGYVYEPWHIRWIGKDLAGQLYATGYLSGSGDYLAAFLASL